jgi:hypothetical protein
MSGHFSAVPALFAMSMLLTTLRVLVVTIGFIDASAGSEPCISGTKGGLKVRGSQHSARLGKRASPWIGIQFEPLLESVALKLLIALWRPHRRDGVINVLSATQERSGSCRQCSHRAVARLRSS